MPKADEGKLTYLETETATGLILRSGLVTHSHRQIRRASVAYEDETCRSVAVGAIGHPTFFRYDLYVSNYNAAQGTGVNN